MPVSDRSSTRHQLSTKTRRAPLSFAIKQTGTAVPGPLATTTSGVGNQRHAHSARSVDQTEESHFWCTSRARGMRLHSPTMPAASNLACEVVSVSAATKVMDASSFSINFNISPVWPPDPMTTITLIFEMDRNELAEFFDEIGDLFKLQAARARGPKKKRQRTTPYVPTGYQRFMSSRRAELKAEPSLAPAKEMMRRVAAEWKALPESEKAKYNDAARQAKVEAVAGEVLDGALGMGEPPADGALGKEPPLDKGEPPAPEPPAEEPPKKKKKKDKKVDTPKDAPDTPKDSTAKKKKKKKKVSEGTQ